MKNNKVIIFDFDGTFYTGKNIFKKLPTFIKKNHRKFLQRLTDDQYRRVESIKYKTLNFKKAD